MSLHKLPFQNVEKIKIIHLFGLWKEMYIKKHIICQGEGENIQMCNFLELIRPPIQQEKLLFDVKSKKIWK